MTAAVTPYYDDGQCVIYHARCEDVLPTIAFDSIVSDPPYGMDYKHGARKGGRRLGHDGRSIAGDDEPFAPSHLLEYAKPTILWGANHFADRLPPSRGWLIWDKRDGRPSNDQSDAEMAWTNILTTARVHSRYWSGNVRLGREQREGRLHVNQKPVALMAWCLRFLPASDDYYTPAWLFDALGLTFDLDVASPPGGVEWVPAARFYTVEDDGLSQPWTGR